MPFPYYQRLSPAAKAIYDKSDRITELPLAQPDLLWPFVDVMRTALAEDNRRAVQEAAVCLCRGLVEMLNVPPVEAEVMAVRPTLRSAELHGLYTQSTRGRPRIRVWMRTARHARVVAFRTFLRTLLHELGHHLDYTYFKLADSLHTEGFFKRESSLFRQLVPEATAPRPNPASKKE